MKLLTTLTTASVVLLLSFQDAAALPACEAWLKNTVPVGPGKFLTPTPGRLVTADMEQVKAAGVTIEAPRRMRAQGYPWDHEIQVALPASYSKTEASFPVLWVTDGSMMFQIAAALVASCANQTIPEMIVIGIGAPPEAVEETQRRRNFDFSPTETRGFSGFGSGASRAREAAGAAKREAEGKPAIDQFGGAPRFLEFIAQDVRNALGKDYRLGKDHTLYGHSGGGLFCAYALVAQPGTFNRYICGSAALAAGDYEVFRIEERTAQQKTDIAAVAFFGAGELEVLDNNLSGIFGSTARLPELLKTRNYPSLKLHFRAFAGEGHTSVIPPLLSEGLRQVWQPDFKQSK